MKVKVYNQTGQATQEEVELHPKIFSISKVKPELVHFVASAILSNMRNTVASTKTRGEVRGGGKKPWAQKGTGRARHGSIRSPLWKGGGVVFGPRPDRNFKKKVNKKVRRLAIFTVLTDRARDNRVLVLDNLQVEGQKTKNLVRELRNFDQAFPAKKTLIVIATKQEDVTKAVRNLPNARVSLANNLNLLDLLWAERVVILKEALPIIEKTYLII